MREINGDVMDQADWTRIADDDEVWAGPTQQSRASQ
jgi:hypothetical protein